MYDLTHTLAAPLLSECEYPWEALPKIGDFILALGATLSEEEYEKRGEDVWIHRTAKVFDSAYIHGPAIIGPETEVRQCAFIRGNALVGAGCVVGNSTEL
jgi:NDP-sugar pyrophosphorylase family protein